MTVRQARRVACGGSDQRPSASTGRRARVMSEEAAPAETADLNDIYLGSLCINPLVQPKFATGSRCATNKLAATVVTACQRAQRLSPHGPIHSPVHLRCKQSPRNCRLGSTPALSCWRSPSRPLGQRKLAHAHPCERRSRRRRERSI